jgi:hypothetical protein
VTTLRTAEWDQFSGCFPDATLVDGAADESLLVSIPAIRLPTGWSQPFTPVWFLVPVGYPAAQPDCFWAAADLRLETGAPPSNAGAQQIPVVELHALWFSWHLANWNPATDTLSTYARFILRRFADAR